MSCLLNYDKQGNAVVKGENASLFNSVLAKTGNEEWAIKMWSTSISSEFKLSGLKANEDNVVKFIELQERVEAKPFKGYEVVDALQASMGQDNFQQRFNDAFEGPTGEFEMNFDRIYNSGLYSADEVEMLFTKAGDIKSIWLRQKGQTIPTLNETPLAIVEKIDGSTTMFGGAQKFNPDEMLSNIVRGEEYEGVDLEGIRNTHSEVKQFVENPLTGELEAKVYDNTYHKLLYGVPTEADTSKIKEVLDFLIEIPGEDFITETNDIKELFKIIDVEAGKLGIDFVGIQDRYNILPTAELMQLIVATRAFVESVENLTEEDVRDFSEVYDAVFKTQEYSQTFVTEKIKNDKSVIRLKSNDREGMYEKHSLVKIKEGFFRKVNKNSDIYEDVYNLARNNTKNIFGEQFPSDKRNSLVYKTKFIKRAHEYAESLMSKFPNLNTEDAKKLVLLEEVFREGSEQENNIGLSQFNRLSTKDNTKLLEEGQSVVIREVIKEKRKGNILPISVSQSGVELLYEGEYTLKNIQNNTIIDVLAINGELNGVYSKIEHLNGFDNVDYLRNYYANNKDRVAEYKGNVEEHGTGLLANTQEPFIKVGGEVYERIGDDNVYEMVESDGLTRWDRKAPKRSFTPEVKPRTSINHEKVKITEPKRNKGSVELVNPLATIPHLTLDQATKAYNNVYSDDFLKTEC